MQTTDRYILAPVTRNWIDHEFYKSALVLGLDIGIEGIGVWLRKGPRPIFFRTFKVTLPEAAPLEKRREKRTGRRARQSRKHRDVLLRAWCQKWGLIGEKDLQRLFADPTKGEKSETHKPFELRLRAITEGKHLASAQALVICLRHIVRHRGYDYHLTNDGEFPWGDELTVSNVVDWAKNAVCSPILKDQIFDDFLQQGWIEKSKRTENLSDERRQELEDENRMKVEDALSNSVDKFHRDPIRKAIEENLQENRHSNLRPAIRGEQYDHPRELVKKHIKEICGKHAHLFGGEDKMKAALVDLIGQRDFDERCILDYHRKTERERLQHAERKSGKCPFAKRLLGQEVVCDFNHHPDVRRFKLQLFLAERQFITKGKGKVYATVELRNWLFQEFLEPDIAATRNLWDKDWPADTKPPARPVKLTKRLLEKKTDLELLPFGSEKNRTHNGNFFDQLTDLLRQDYAVLKKRAKFSGVSAEQLFKTATKNGTVFRDENVRKNLAEYYQMRRDMQGDFFGVYPQVEFLMGHRKQYDAKGNPKDKSKDGKPRYHGILRRLLAGQLELDDGTVVDLAKELGGAMKPEYVVIETIADIPRNEKERQEYQAEQKQRRDWKRGLSEGMQLTDKQQKQCILYEQQDGLCPYTGRELNDALADDLAIDHIFPKSKGGISELRNLVLTHKTTNHAKGERLPYEAAALPNNPFGRSWKEIVADLPKMKGWRRGGRDEALEKIDIVMLEDSSQVPDWGNTTRVAQLARQLREEVICWLGIRQQFDNIADPKERDNQIANEIFRRIGTPSGFMTGCCRKSWLDQNNIPRGFKLLEIQEDGKTVKRIVKDRNDLRHHMIDAAILSHIPPGTGMNLALHGGIFIHNANTTEGDVTMEALPGLGPDLASFEVQHKDECLVSESRRMKSKAKRFEETIYSLPDKDGNMMARVKLSDLVRRLINKKSEASAEKIFELFTKAGLTGKIPLGKVCQKEGLPDKTEKNGLSVETVRRWWENCQREFFTVEEVTEFLREKGISEETLSDATIKDWKWKGKKLKQRITVDSLRWFLGSKIKSWLSDFKKQTMTLPQLKEFLLAKELNGEPLTDEAIEKWWGDKPERKIGIKEIGKLFRANRVSLCPLPDARLEELFEGGVPSDNELRLPDGTLITSIPEVADKEAPTSLMPHKNHKKEVVGFKKARESFVRVEIWFTESKDGEDKIVRYYWCRLIPHARGLAALPEREMKCTGERLSWERPLTDNELKELGLDDHPAVKRLRSSFAKKLKQWERKAAKLKSAAGELELNASVPTEEKPTPPAISLRKIYTGLPAGARPLLGKKLCRIAKGDLLRVPIRKTSGAGKGDGKFCGRNEPATGGEYWYRVTAIKADGEVSMTLAEFDKPKAEKEKKLREDEAWLAKIFMQRPMSADDLAYLLEYSRGDDQPSHSAK